MTVTTSPRLGVTRWSAGTDPFTRDQMDASMAALEANAAMFAQGTLAARPAAGKAGRLYRVSDAAEAAATVWWDTGAAWVEVRGDLSAYAKSADVQSALDGKAASVHTHAASAVTSGIFSPGRLGSGAADETRVLYGDSTWKVLPAPSLAGDTDTTISSPQAGHFLQYDPATSKWVNSPIATSEVTGLDTALGGKAAATHSHGIADLPVAASGASSTTQLVRADDSRLSNARTPLAHSHGIADLPVAASGASSTTQLVRADDSRLTNTRTPSNDADLVHKATAETISGAKTFSVEMLAAGGVRVGDDVRISDIDTAHLLGVLSTTDANRGGVRLGASWTLLANGAAGSLAGNLDVVGELKESGTRVALGAYGGNELAAAIVVSNSTATMNAAAASVFTTSHNGTLTLAITNAPAGRACTLTLVVSFGSLAGSVVLLPTGGYWLGSAPVSAANKRMVITMMSPDGGATWACSGSVQI